MTGTGTEPEFPPGESLCAGLPDIQRSDPDPLSQNFVPFLNCSKASIPFLSVERLGLVRVSIELSWNYCECIKPGGIFLRLGGSVGCLKDVLCILSGEWTFARGLLASKRTFVAVRVPMVRVPRVKTTSL